MYKGNKRRLTKAVSVFMAAALVLTSVPIGAKTSKKKAVTKLQVTSPYSENGQKVTTTLTLKKGSTFKIKTGVSPKSADKKLVYKSSKKKVATVSKSGKIKAKKVGKTNITIQPKSNKKVKAVIKVTVVKKLKKVKKIKLDKSALSLSTSGNNSTAQLKATVASPKKPTVKKFNWFTSDKKVATVSKKGVVTAKKAGRATITVTSADGHGAKAVCKVTVTEGKGPNPPAPSGTPSPTSGVKPSDMPDTSASPTPATELTIVEKGKRTGIKQGESLQLTVVGQGADMVSWTVSELDGVAISESGLLTVAKTVESGSKITVTATTSADVKVKTDSVTLTIVENEAPVLTDKQLQLNQSTAANPLGLTYRSDKAVSIVSDPERGDIVRVDSAIGFKNDMVAWMEVDPIYAGKTVTISAYIKYDEMPDRDYIGLVLNERWDYSNPVKNWVAYPGEWYYLEGTFQLPEYKDYRYDGTRNMLYLCKWSELSSSECPVYYLDDLRFVIEKSEISEVTLSAAGDATEIYQNHNLQFSAEVAGTNNPIQKVNYSIEPAVAGATIDENGLLQVGNVPANTKIIVKAAAYEDESKYATKEITVLPQTLTSVSVSAEKINPNETNPTAEQNPKEIYAGEQVTFKETVVSTGEPDTSVIWSVSPATAGVTLTAGGVLTVTEAVPDNTALTVKATSKFDASKSDEYAITVKKNKISKVTVNSAGNKTTVSNELPLSLSATIEKSGIPSEEVVWAIVNPTDGVSLASLSGKNNTLSVTAAVAAETSITVRATSVFDSTQYGEITVTVEGESSDEFDFNRCTVEYWEDFNSTTSVATMEELLAQEDGVISHKSTVPEKTDEGKNWLYSYVPYIKTGIHLMDDSLSMSKKRTSTFRQCFGSKDDYVQFAVKNVKDKAMKYTLSFMINFERIYDHTTVQTSEYELPLKLVTKDGTIVKDNIRLPYLCNATMSMYNKEFYEICASVEVPARETVYLQLKLDDDLPLCQCPDSHEGFEQESHPVECKIENVAIINGSNSTISLGVGETYQLELDTVEGDEVTYYTNSYLAKYTHEDKDTTCERLLTTVADVDATGKITANKAGETALIAEIKRGDEVIRKQCIVEVK